MQPSERSYAQSDWAQWNAEREHAKRGDSNQVPYVILQGARGPDKKLAAVLTREVVECVCKLMAIVALPLGRSP